MAITSAERDAVIRCLLSRGGFVPLPTIARDTGIYKTTVHKTLAKLNVEVGDGISDMNRPCKTYRLIDTEDHADTTSMALKLSRKFTGMFGQLHWANGSSK